MHSQWSILIILCAWCECFTRTHGLLVMCLTTGQLAPPRSRITSTTKKCYRRDGGAASRGQITASTAKRRPSFLLARAASDSDKEAALRKDAKVMLEKAREIRNGIGQSSSVGGSRPSSSVVVVSKWNVPATSEASDAMIRGEDYRLYIDIGRENGSWMDPRWAASGRRIDFTLDVRFTDRTADAESCGRMVADNMAGAKTITKCLLVASHGRLNNGFNEIKCRQGAYRIDLSNNNNNNNNKQGVGGTVRFVIGTDGTLPKSATDVWIPSGDLHFSLPVFGNTVAQLSQKAGIVSVRQMGWNTGWRRVESRIVGIFRAVRFNDAKRRDGF